MARVKDRISHWKNTRVGIESTMGAVSGNGVTFIPVFGTLVEVFDDGFEVLLEGTPAPTVFLFENVRSIRQVSDLVVPSASKVTL